jgi:lysyl-tRNA synthetase, class II
VGEDLRQVRIEKLQRIRDAGINPYPERFARSHTLAQARVAGSELKDRIDQARAKSDAAGSEVDHSALKVPVKVAGRMVLFRHMGKLSFGRIQDANSQIQISLERGKLDPDKEKSRENYNFFRKITDIGDFIGLDGFLYFTKKGELTVSVERWTFLGKALRPLPEKHGGLQNQELAWRQRYLDLIASEESRGRFRTRIDVTKSIRNYLDEHQFLEVETPILCGTASGAAARPFHTHHNSLDMEVHLRIAPETYLKRLIVAGYDRVYEFARCFRNEGMDPSHLQDFTMLEYYCSYWNYEDNMTFTQELIQHVLKAVKGSLKFSYDGRELDFSGDWPRLSMRDLVSERSGIDIEQYKDREALLKVLDENNISIENRDAGRGNLIDQLYKKTVRPHLINPVFLIKHPTDLSPLARANDDNPAIVDRFQLVVNSWEIVNAYSELVDPIDQRGRLEQQAAAKASGDDEAMPMDEDYLTAMEYGMPPISGWGMGIDRFVALLTDAQNLRDTVFFPLMRPITEAANTDQDAGPDG